MRKGMKIAAVIGGGAVAAGAFAAPALAGNGQGPAAPQAGYQQMHRNGSGPGNGDALQLRARDGTYRTVVAAGTLTEAQRTQLAAMAADEKLAHDLYTEFAETYQLRVFSNLASAEASHLRALRTLMDRYGITDPTAGKAAGVFASAQVQATYDRLLAEGKSGQQAALTVARSLEQQAIARYGDAVDGLQAPAAEQVYSHLRTAETRHLAAISNWLTS